MYVTDVDGEEEANDFPVHVHMEEARRPNQILPKR